MAVLFADSFDHYATADGSKKWTHFIGAQIGAFGRNGTNGLFITDTAGGFGYCRKVFSSTKTTLIAGVGFTPLDASLSGFATFGILGFDDAAVGGEQVCVYFNYSDMKLRVQRNGTVLATGTTTLMAGVAYHIEFKATIDSAAGAYTLRVNEIQELDASGVNTRGTGTNNSADSVRVGNIGGVVLLSIGYFDDFYCCDSLGGVNNDFLGDCRVQCLFPDGAGATTGWTPFSGANYTNVDDTTPDNDTTYVSTGSAGTIDTYSMSDLAATTGSVKAVQTVIDARKDDSGTRTIAPVFHIGATDYVGSNQNIMTTYSMFLQQYDKSPATAVAWTVSEVNALNAGQKLVA